MQSGEYLCIKGLSGRRALEGKIAVHGAKNSVLKVLASALLFEGELIIQNVPRLKDVYSMLDILENLGVKHSFENERTLKLKVSKDLGYKLSDEAKNIRASIALTGPVLARVGKVVFPFPGGDKIGIRPIDLFLESFEKFGAKVNIKSDEVEVVAKKLKGTEIFFRRQSVTATESAMMLAIFAEGTSVLKNAAMEPEVYHLAEFLNASGANIKGHGTHTIKIEGIRGALRAKEAFSVPPDRIEAGSFLALASVSGKDILIENCLPAELEAVLEQFKYMGLNIEVGKDFLRVKETRPAEKLHAQGFVTHEYPGFPTDMQAPAVAALTQMSGEALVFETIFENRFVYTESLRLMGANILELDTHRVLVKGPSKLHGRNLRSLDIRAGLSYIIAATSAEGESKILDVYHIDRGYENIEQRLKSIGLDIERKQGQI